MSAVDPTNFLHEKHERPEHLSDADNGTVFSSNGFRLSEEDIQAARDVIPSRVSGKGLTWMVSLEVKYTSQGSDIPYQVTFVAGTGFTLFGYDQGVMSGLLTLPSFEAQFPNTAGGFEGSRTATLQSFMVAICKFSIALQYTHLFSNSSPRRDWLYDGCHFKYLDW